MSIFNWLIEFLLKKHINNIHKLSNDMRSKEMNEWEKGFVCGLYHFEKEIIPKTESK